MPALALYGPSYKLRSTNAEGRRAIGWIPVQIESQTGKGGTPAYMKQQPGLVSLVSALGTVSPGSLCYANGKLYAVAGGRLLEISSDWTHVDRGAIVGGNISMRANRTQLCIVAAPSVYVYDFEDHTLTAGGYPFGGAISVDILSGYGIFPNPDSNQYFLSAAEDFGTVDSLDFASIERTPGNIVSCIVNRAEVVFLKDQSAEVWYNAGGSDFAFARNDSAAIDVGCLAGQTTQKLAGVVYWLGQDASGAFMVFAMNGYSPTRISSHALEEQLSALDDVSDAYAWTYQQEGLSYYVLNVPGLETSWVYEVASGIWHERAEWVDGAYSQWRPVCHAFAFNKHVVADADGNLYELTPDAGSNAGDVLIRDLITPHQAASNLARERIHSFQIDCDVAQGLSASQIMLRYSNDGGRTWGNWRYLSLGDVGRTMTRVRTTMLGSARDRVWHIRCTDDVQCNLLRALYNE